ncbi:MAG: hypothetical protein ACFE8U_10285 [Candidatus Hermodarchaeota archaeon]
MQFISRWTGRIKQLIQEFPYSFLALLGVIILIFISSVVSITEGPFLIIMFSIIVAEVIIGSVFLLFNTSSLLLAMFFQDDLSEFELTWVKQKMKRNMIIIFLWLLTILGSFFLVGGNLGIVAALYLLALVVLFHSAGLEENPFIEQRYEF